MSLATACWAFGLEILTNIGPIPILSIGSGHPYCLSNNSTVHPPAVALTYHPYLRGSFRLTRAPPSQCRTSICGEFQVKANDPKVESPTVDRLTKMIVRLIVEPGSIGIKSLETGYCIFFSTAFHHLD